MAWILNDAPIGGLLYAAYVSQQFEVQDEQPADRQSMALQVLVRNNEINIEPDPLYFPAIEKTTDFTTDTFIFRFDLKDITARLFKPVTLLPTILGGSHNVTFPNEIPEIDVLMQTWKANSDNLLELDPYFANTIKYRVLNAVRYNDEDPFLVDYTAATGRKFLTTKPLAGWTDLKANEFLYVWNPDDTQFYWIFKFYSPTGVLKSTLRVNNSDQDNRLMCKGVGGMNVLNTSFDAVIYSDGDGDGNGIVPRCAYYEVFGSGNTGGTSPITDVRRYYIKRSGQCINYRIHFLNKFGVWDFYPVVSEENDLLNMSNDTYETALPPTFSTGAARVHVRNRGQVRGDLGFDVEVAGFSPTVGNWLQELSISPLAFIERDPRDQVDNPRLYPIVIENNQFDISAYTFKFSAFESREIISQRV